MIISFQPDFVYPSNRKDLDENESTADQTHFQVIDRQIRIFVLFEHLLCQKRFSSVRCTRNQYDHFFLVKIKYVSIGLHIPFVLLPSIWR